MVTALVLTSAAALTAPAPALRDLRVTNGSVPYLGDWRLLTTVSPNRDGFRDQAVVHFRLQRPATVRLEVVATNMVRAGQGGTTIVWKTAHHFAAGDGDSHLASGAGHAAAHLRTASQGRKARLRRLRPGWTPGRTGGARPGNRRRLHEAQLRAGRDGRAPARDRCAPAAVAGLCVPVPRSAERAGCQDQRARQDRPDSRRLARTP